MKKILSIQSSVTVGFVGNAVAGPVLLAMGHHPMMIDTISLAAHPGYGGRAGGPLADHLFAAQLDGLQDLGETGDIAQIMTGYLGSVGQIDSIVALLTSWQAEPSGHYILDPVMGDAGRLYVSADLADGIRTRLLPLADIITPNQFELAQLSGTDITDLDSAADAAATLLTQHAMTAIIITGVISAPVGADQTTADHKPDIGDLLIMRDGTQVWHPTTSTAKNVAGGGDLLTALFSGYLASGLAIQDAFSKASATAHTIIAASPTPRDLALLEHLGLLAESQQP